MLVLFLFSMRTLKPEVRILFKCPFCNQPMEESNEEHGPEDLFCCGACEVEKLMYWQPGEYGNAQKTEK